MILSSAIKHLRGALRSALVLAIVAPVLAAFAMAGAHAQTSSRPHIIHIVSDDQGWKDCWLQRVRHSERPISTSSPAAARC